MQPDQIKCLHTLRTADRVVANSRFTANLLRNVGVSPERIEVVHPGCNSQRFRPRAPKQELKKEILGERHADKVILSVGNLVSRKGQDMVIRALAALRHKGPQATYLIVGEGPHRTELEKLAAALGVSRHVVFAGRVDGDLVDIYALADVFAMPSREQLEACDVEGFGLVFLEASACAKPVIGGRSGGIPDAVVDGFTGLLVDPSNPNEIAHALALLLTDAELATRLGQQGRSWVVDRFDWSRVGASVGAIIESVSRDKSVVGRRRRHQSVTPPSPLDSSGTLP
jgi:phosphatidylinositol alpha-1,6-mannosyltransferase